LTSGFSFATPIFSGLYLFESKSGFGSGTNVEGDRLIALGATGATGATGVKKAGSRSKAAKSDRWHLGSCGKAMKATLVARLVEKMKLRWDATIGKAAPWMRKTMHPDYRDVTIEQLLSHRGGIAGNLVKDHPQLWRKLRLHSGPPRKARRLLVDELLRTPPVEKPDTAFVYSNAGYVIAGVIAGVIAEQETGRSWEELMQREVFAPLGMRSAGFGAPKSRAPWGHRKPDAGGKPVPPGPLGDNPFALGPAGTSSRTWGRIRCGSRSCSSRRRRTSPSW